jgi:hypothetical protein
MAWRFALVLSALVITAASSACTNITQSGEQNNACTNHSLCNQGRTKNPPAPNCQARALDIRPNIVTQRSSAINEQQNAGTYELSVNGYWWSGIFIKVPISDCGYDVNFNAMLYPATPGPGAGFGYGFGACDTWSGTEPRGFEVQYSAYQDQSGKLFNSAGWIPLGYPNNLTPVKVPVDFNSHAWSINVRANELTFTEDEGVSSESFPLTNANAKGYDTTLLPATCNNTGIFIRVYNAKAVFSNFSANELAS